MEVLRSLWSFVGINSKTLFSVLDLFFKFRMWGPWSTIVSAHPDSTTAEICSSPKGKLPYYLGKVRLGHQLHKSSIERMNLNRPATCSLRYWMMHYLIMLWFAFIVQQLSKHTDPGHPDSFHIESALETMKQMINILNDSIQSSCKLASNYHMRRSQRRK